MKITKEKKYNEILKLINQLPEQDIKKLVKKLQNDMASGKSTSSLQEIILKAPTWSDKNNEGFKKVRDHINKSRIA